MGCVESKADPDREADRAITKNLRSDFKQEGHIYKILLLGTGESGKSTIFKQMRILYQTPFSDEERRGYASAVFSNMFEMVKALAKEALKAVSDESVIALLEEMNAAAPNRNEEIWKLMASVWQCDAVQSTLLRRSELNILDNIDYFFSAFERVSSTDYRPSDQDILNLRVRTTGITQLKFKYGNEEFRMMDVGGQRSERRKWIHCFDNCDIILFLAAISEYDQTLFESHDTNRLQESLVVFGEICNSRFLKHTNMVLFLNKVDIFSEKLKRVNLSTYFPDYTGGSDEVKALEFLKGLFKEQNQSTERFLHIHVTCATDSKQVDVVFKGVKTAVLNSNLDGAQF